MKTEKILVSQAIPGMVVAASVYTKDNHLIIAKDTTLTDRIITRLVFYSITELCIYTFDKSDIKFIKEDSTYYDQIKESEAFKRFYLAYQNTVNGFKKSIDTYVMEKNELNTKEILEDVLKILTYSDSTIDLFHMLHCMRSYDDTTYVHCLNVALICNIMGKWLNFSQEDLETITLCGLLHDIGKLMIPSSIISKPDKLTTEEFQTIKTHTTRGYNLLKGKKIDSRVKYSILMHHERCDGSGYPYGFYSEQIDPFARLVAIADVYDAMTSARVYRGPLSPFHVISIFETEGLTKYDPKYIMTFLESIVMTYIHASVLLSNGKVGEIIFINKLNLSKPVVKIGDKFIDLSKEKDLQIEAIV